MSEFISVAFQGKWDPSGDAKVLESVKKISAQINSLLEGAVNFAETVKGIERIAAAFDKITKSATNVEAAMRATKRAQEEEETSVRGLIAAYKFLDEIASKPRASTAVGAKKEMEERAKAIKVLRELERKAENEQQKTWANNQWERQLQTIRAVNGEYKRIIADSDAIAKGADSAAASQQRYLSEIKKVNGEIKKYRNASYGEEGIDRQIAGYQRLKVIRKEMADAGLMDEAESSKIINRLNGQIRELTNIKKVGVQLDREGSEASKNRRRAEVLEIDKLRQQHEKLNKSLMDVPNDGAAANIALRTKMEKELQEVILKRIQLGDRTSNELRKEYEQIMRNASGVDRLEQELRVLKAIINSPLQSENLLASMQKRLEYIDMAINTAKALKSVGGVEGDAGAKEMAKLKNERKLIADQMQIILNDQIKEIDLTNKEIDRVQKLRQEYNKLRGDAAVGASDKSYGGMLNAKASLTEAARTARQLYKEGGIGKDVYEREIADISKQMLSVRSELRKYEKELQGVESSAAKGVRAQIESLEKLQKKYQDLTKTIQQMEEANVNPVTLKPKYEALRTALKGLYDNGIIGLDEYNTKNIEASKRLAQLDAQTKKLHASWGKSFRDLIKYQAEWYLGTTMILGGFFAFAEAIKKSFDFTQNIRDAKAVIGATEEEFRRMQDAVLNVGKTISISASEASTAIKILGQAGLNAEQSIASLETVAGLVVATGGDMEETVKSVTTVMNVWNYESSRVAEIGNVMAASLNYSKLEMKDLGVVFNYLASTASEVGWSFEQTSAAAAVLANQGIRVSTIGTGLSSVVSSLIAPTKKMVDTFADFGLTMEDLDPRTHSFADILDKLQEKGFGVDAAFQAFNKREARILAASINAGADAFREMTVRLTGTDAMLKMVDDSMAGAKRQFELLGIEIQNRFNRSMMEGESAVAAFAKVLRYIVGGAMDAALPIAGLNIAMMALSASSTKAARGVSLLSKAFQFIGGWWGVAAIAGSILIGVLSQVYETTEEMYAKLEEGHKKDLVAAEGFRQRATAMSDFLKVAEKQSGNEQELARLKDQLIQQDSNIIKFLEAQGIAAHDTEVNYQDLAIAIKNYRDELQTLRKQSDSKALEKQVQEVILAKNKVDSIRGEMSTIENPQLQHEFDVISFDPKALEKMAGDISGWENKINSFFDSVRNKARSLAKDPEAIEALRAELDRLFTAADDQEGLKRALQAVDAGIQDQKKKVAASQKAESTSWTKTNKEIKAAFDERRQFIDETYDYFIEKVQHSTISEKEMLEQSASLYKEKASMLIGLADEEAKARIAALDKVNMTVKEREAALSRISVDASKAKMKAWDDMNKQLKQIAQEQMAYIDYQFQASVENTQSIYDLKAKAIQDSHKTEIQQSRDSVRLEKQRIDDVVGLHKGEAERKKSIINKTFADEKEKRKEIAKINRDALDKESDAYESLKDKMLGIFDASKARAEKLKDDFKQLGQNIKDSFGMANRALEDIFGKSEMKPNDVLSEVADMQAKVKKLMATGQKDNLEQASELALKSMEVLKGIDYEKYRNQSGPTLKDEIKDAAVEAEELYRKSQKGLQSLNKSEQVNEKNLQSSLKNQISFIQSELDRINEQKIKLGVEVDPSESRKVKDQIEQNVKPKVEVELSGNLEQVEAQMKKALSDAEQNGAKIPVIPFAKQEDLDLLRTQLQDPANKPINLETPNIDEIRTLLAQLAAPVTKYIHIKEVRGGSGEEAPSEGSGSETGDTSGTPGYATGGWLPGYGGGDRIKVLAEAGEFINRKESVGYYSKEFFDLLNSRAIPRELIYEALKGAKPQKFAAGGLVEGRGAAETFTLALNFGGGDYPLQVLMQSRDVFRRFMERYEKENLMRRKN